jgi:uncharacterized membrane protein (DUF485 family)
MREKDKQKVGMVLLILGFIILVINAVDYLSGFFGAPLNIKFTSSGIGAILFIFGMFLTGIFSAKKMRIR